MSAMDDFAGRLRGFLISLGDKVNAEDAEFVMHLIDHDEGGEAIISVASSIAEHDGTLTSHEKEALLSFARSLGVEEELPPRFRMSGP
jgi:tellurite resistance protein